MAAFNLADIIKRHMATQSHALVQDSFAAPAWLDRPNPIQNAVTVHYADDGARRGNGETSGTYSGSHVNNVTGDFLGDWRSADGWIAMDSRIVRARSRQLERGNPWCGAFATSAVNNVLGHRGFTQTMKIVRSRLYGDDSEGVMDVEANRAIMDARVKFEKAKNFTTRKRLTRKQVDKLLLRRLIFDGEFIMQRRPGFDNEFNFSWQMIDPDYLDSTLSKINPKNGNVIKMGVELDRVDKFPVAYWFLRNRPNDYIQARAFNPERYIRVEARDVIHVFMQDYDTEQTRGWPWVFAAAVNLHRMQKFEEAALINATIGASKMGFFKKTTPDGFTAADLDELDETDEGAIIDRVVPGMWTELPWNVEPVDWSPEYPNSEFESFEKAMLRGIAAAFGTSYMVLSKDLSEANFSSLRAGLNEDQEQWMMLQEFLIENWKMPEFDEWLYRAILSQQVKLPISKFEKFNKTTFTGKRWPYVNPLQDLQAIQLELDNRLTSPSIVVAERGGDWEELKLTMATDQKWMEDNNITRVHSTFQFVDVEAADLEKKQKAKESKKPLTKEPKSN